MNCAKKISIKNFKGFPNLCPIYREKQLSQLESAVTSIYHGHPLINISYEELYRSVENPCTYNLKERLYENLYTIVENYLKTKTDLLIKLKVPNEESANQFRETLSEDILKTKNLGEENQEENPREENQEKENLRKELLENKNQDEFLEEEKLENKNLKNEIQTNQDKQNPTRFLEALNSTWLTYCKHSKLINNIYLFLDRNTTNDKYVRSSIWVMNLTLFKTNIILNSAITEHLIEEILNLIDKERRECKERQERGRQDFTQILKMKIQERPEFSISKNLIKSVINMLINLQVYEDIFSPKFLQVSDNLYKEESAKLMEKFHITDYLLYVQQRLQEEEERLKAYLHKSTEKPLMDILKKRLLKEHLQTILDRGVDELAENNKLSELSLLYRLLEQVSNGHAELSRIFSAYLIKTGKCLVQDPEKDKTMVENLLQFKDKIDNIVAVSFENNTKFIDGVRNSFKFFINQRHNKPAELLAKFVDGELKSKSTEEDIERILNKVMVIFRFIQGKDIFEAFYKKDLAKRLLVGKSASQDAENSMISKLKLECGSGFTAKLEGMFKDIRLSQDLNGSFKQHLINSTHLHNVRENVEGMRERYEGNFGQEGNVGQEGNDGQDGNGGLIGQNGRIVEENVGLTGLNVGHIGQSLGNIRQTTKFFCDMNINVLTTGYWPTFPIYNVSLPEEMVSYQSIFQKFYIATYSGRKLQWQPNLGFCILKAAFPWGSKELQVSLFQTIILLLFNSADEIAYKDIKELTNLEENELKRTLQSLACGRSRVLLKVPKGKDVGDEDIFVFNSEFTDKLFRVKINQVQMKESVEEQQATEDGVLHDRQYQMDAAIVRIMKQKKVLSHNLLINELYNLLDIPVKPMDFKKRIEQLIDREYIERDKENVNFYRYVA